MNCAAFEERIALYVGGDLAPAEASKVEQHLRSCADCAELARALEADREWLASRPPEAAEVDFAAMRREIRREIARPRWGWKWLAAAAAILVAVGLANTLRKTARVERTVLVAPRNEVVAAIPVPTPPARMITRRTEPRPKGAVVPPPPPIQDESESPVEIQIATSDPDVTIILLHEYKGVSQ